jgi:hypothetical protein
MPETPARSRGWYRVALTAIAAAALLALGFEWYGRWVARNMAVIVKAAVEAPRAGDWSSADAPANSVVLFGADTVAEVTGVLTFNGSAHPRTGFLAVLTDSTAGSRFGADAEQVAVQVQETPIVLQIRAKQAADTLPAARLWIAQLARFIPVYPGGGSAAAQRRRQ